ncbi:MAG: hypothetical protein J6D27_08990 [Ruminiclostridium sp.]|nr:hypothetical protein [Ruminiclostridium sp.]
MQTNIKNGFSITTYDGFVHCRSSRYTCYTAINNEEFHFSPGLNVLKGDIDESWAISYLLSMYSERPKDFALDSEPEIVAKDKRIPLNELSESVCYIDECYSLFKSKKTVLKLIERGIASTGNKMTADEIVQAFSLERLDRRIKYCGNEKWRSMCAIGCAYSKDVFCFPWISKKMGKYYQGHFKKAISALCKLQKIILFPTNCDESDFL